MASEFSRLQEATANICREASDTCKRVLNEQTVRINRRESSSRSPVVTYERLTFERGQDVTYQEAKNKAMASGIPEDQITGEDLRLFGYEVGDPTAGVVPVVAIDPKQVKDDLALLQKEAESNSWTGVAFGALSRIIGFASKALLPLILVCLLLSGCASTQATHSVDQAAISVQALNEGHLAFEEAFIQDYRNKESERIDQLYLDAVKSHTTTISVLRKTPKAVRTVDAAGKVISETTVVEEVPTAQDSIDPSIADALLKQKIKLYQQMEANTVSMRTKQGKICQNAANASAYLEGLHSYFSQKAVTFEQMNTASTGLMDFLEKFATSKLGVK